MQCWGEAQSFEVHVHSCCWAVPQFYSKPKGIKANPKKIKALLEMEALRNSREVQKLAGCVATLNKFVLKVAEKCVSCFDALSAK